MEKEKKKKRSKKIGIILGLILLLTLSFFLLKRGSVSSNEIGLLITKNGTNINPVIKNGLVLGLPGKELVKYPLDRKVIKLTTEKKNEVAFRSKDRILLRAEIYFECQVIPNKAIELYKEYQTGFDVILKESITQNIRDEFVYQASTMEADSIMDNQEAFILAVQEKAIKNVAKNNLQLHKIGYLKPILIPENLTAIVEEIIFSKELTQKAKIDRDRSVFIQELEEAENKRLLDSTVTHNLITLHSQMTQNELRINQFKTDSTIYKIKYTGNILEAMRIENFTKAIEKWDGKLPSSGVPNLNFPFEDSKQKMEGKSEELNITK